MEKEMSDDLLELGRRLRAIRESRGEAPADTAKALGVETAAYLQIEAGEADLPVGLLLRLTRHAGVSAGELLGDGSPHLHQFNVVRHGNGLTIHRRAAYHYVSLAPQFANKQMEPVLVTVPAETPAPAIPCVHIGQEFDYVVEGTLEVTLGAHVVVLAPGDSVYFDAAQPHAMRALEGRPARFLAVVTGG